MEEDGRLDCSEEWASCFTDLQRTLQELSKSIASDAQPAEEQRLLALKRVSRLCRRIFDTASGAEAKRVEIGAVESGTGVVTVAGEPEDFAADLCPILLRHTRLPDPADDDLAPELTVLLTLLGSPRFGKKLEMLRRKHELPVRDTAGVEDSDAFEDTGGGEDAATASAGTGEEEGEKTATELPEGDAGVSGGAGGKPSSAGSSGSHTSDDRESKLKYHQQQAEQLKAGALIPDTKDSGDQGTKKDRPSDEGYREAVLQYEERHGRFAVEKPPDQEGHDIDSFSAPEDMPNRQLIRRIEVKGRTHEWTEAQTVELSRPQFDAANGQTVEDGLQCDPDFDYWLYVVEDLGDDTYRVLPIRNPARSASKYEVRGGTWRQFADEQEDVRIGKDAGASANGNAEGGR